jgi:hypothetical protein
LCGGRTGGRGGCRPRCVRRRRRSRKHRQQKQRNCPRRAASGRFRPPPAEGQAVECYNRGEVSG